MTCDFVLEVGPAAAGGGYHVGVDSPAGTARGTAQLDALQLLGRRRELAATVLASGVTSRSRVATEERPVREMGSELFAAVFAERIYGRYTASVQEAARRGEPLRIVLRLRAPELAGLPWETLYDGESGEYICQREPVVRYVETAQPVTPLAVEPPLRILAMVASPADLPALDVDEERRRLRAAMAGLAERGQVELVWATGGSWPALQAQLQAGPWHVVHFVGHGGMSGDAGVLVLEDEVSRRSTMVSATRFARLLHACRPVPRLVVLNSCQSGEAAADDLLSSTAAALVNSGIAAAVAMQFPITDPAAIAFARGFYQALANGAEVDEAVRLGRIAIDGTGERTLEWVTPVLHLRSEDTKLFDVAAGPGESRPHGSQAGPSDERVAQTAALHGLYVEALAAMRTGRDDEAVTLLDSVLALDPHYRDAPARRDAARRAQQLTAGYQRARTAEEAGDWDQAEREYSQVVGLDAHYQDAGARRDACRRQARLAALQDELRCLVESGNWQAALAAADELAALDSDAAAQVAELVAAARHELDLQAQREAAEEQRRDEAEPGPLLKATEVEQRQPPTRPQVETVSDAHQGEEIRHQRIAGLQRRLHAAADGDDWQAVITAADQLSAIDPQAATTDELMRLVDKARNELRRETQSKDGRRPATGPGAASIGSVAQAPSDGSGRETVSAAGSEIGVAPGRRPRRLKMIIALSLAALAAATAAVVIVLVQGDTDNPPARVHSGPIDLGGRNPQAITITPDGTTAYVALRPNEGDPTADTVLPVDLTTDTPGKPIEVGENPDAIAITPDGSTAYVANTDDDTVTPIDLATDTASKPIEVGEGPRAIAITPDGSTAYVANATDHTVTPIDLATDTAGKPIEVGKYVNAVAITPDGATAYVANADDDTVTPIDLATNRPGQPIEVGAGPAAIAIAPDGSTAYVAAPGDDAVIPIDLATNTAGKPIEFGKYLNAIAIAPDGSTAYVTDFLDGTVTPIDLATNSPSQPIEVGKYLEAIAITPDGSTAYVADASDDRVIPIDLATNTADTGDTATN